MLEIGMVCVSLQERAGLCRASGQLERSRQMQKYESAQRLRGSEGYLDGITGRSHHDV